MRSDSKTFYFQKRKTEIQLSKKESRDQQRKRAKRTLQAEIQLVESPRKDNWRDCGNTGGGVSKRPRMHEG